MHVAVGGTKMGTILQARVLFRFSISLNSFSVKVSGRELSMPFRQSQNPYNVSPQVLESSANLRDAAFPIAFSQFWCWGQFPQVLLFFQHVLLAAFIGLQDDVSCVRSVVKPDSASQDRGASPFIHILKCICCSILLYLLAKKASTHVARKQVNCL